MIVQSIIGFAAFALIAFLLSENRRMVSMRTVAVGMALQVGIAAVLLKFPLFRELFVQFNRVILSIEESTTAGTSFVFGYLGGGSLPFKESYPGASFILAFKALPLVLVISALSSLMFYWKILPKIVVAFAKLLRTTMGIGGTEGLGVSANIFVGMVESPLFVRPYIQDMTRSELFTIMTCGMATIAGTVMVVYASILRDAIPDVMGHILTASIISAPAAVVVAKIMIPETGELTAGELVHPEGAQGAMDAITKGTRQGIELLLNIAAMIVVLVALVHLVNLGLGLLPEIGGKAVTLQRVLGLFMAPVVWLMGVPWSEAADAGALMGTKTVLNEFIAYLDLAALPPGTLQARSLVIMTYGLCGFANPGSLGIMIGGIGAMAPGRRDEVVALGMRSVVAGTIATSMTGAVVGMLMPQ